MKYKRNFYYRGLVVLTVIFISFYNAYAQQKTGSDSLKFTLFERDQCVDTCRISLLYHFTEKGSDKKYQADSKTGVCTLPHKGVYQLYFLDVDYPLNYIYKGQVSDTLNVPELFYGFPPMHSPIPPHWIFCNVTANGIMVDYFKSGKKRLKGKFRNGKLIGKLSYYDLEGRLVRIENKHNFKKY